MCVCAGAPAPQQVQVPGVPAHRAVDRRPQRSPRARLTCFNSTSFISDFVCLRLHNRVCLHFLSCVCPLCSPVGCRRIRPAGRPVASTRAQYLPIGRLPPSLEHEHELALHSHLNVIHVAFVSFLRSSSRAISNDRESLA